MSTTLINSKLSTEEKGKLFMLMEKYENTTLSDSLSRVIQNQYTNDDLLEISKYMDYRDMELDESEFLDEVLGEEMIEAFFVL